MEQVRTIRKALAAAAMTRKQVPKPGIITHSSKAEYS